MRKRFNFFSFLVCIDFLFYDYVTHTEGSEDRYEKAGKVRQQDELFTRHYVLLCSFFTFVASGVRNTSLPHSLSHFHRFPYPSPYPLPQTLLRSSNFVNCDINNKCV